MRGYDIIGDVHGCASKLIDRLISMGYRRGGGDGAYAHPDYHAVFVGDLIDRGPQQRETLELVKAMVDAGSASIVMGNHEFNAVAYAMEHPEHPGSFLRTHNEKHTGQHQAFLDQLTPSQQEHYVEWFKTLPLWLTLDLSSASTRTGKARVVHACWHEHWMNVVQQSSIEESGRNIQSDGTSHLTTDEQWVLANTKGSDLYNAIEVLLKGPEIPLKPYGVPPYLDKDKNPRDKARLCWWKEGGRKLSDVTELATYGVVVPDVELKSEDDAYVYHDKIPVFYGHYWRKDVPSHEDDFTDHTACVDFSAVSSEKGGGTLVAYRWEGEATIEGQRYHPQGAAHKV